MLSKKAHAILHTGEIVNMRAWGAMEQPTDLRLFCCS